MSAASQTTALKFSYVADLKQQQHSNSNESKDYDDTYNQQHQTTSSCSSSQSSPASSSRRCSRGDGVSDSSSVDSSRPNFDFGNDNKVNAKAEKMTADKNQENHGSLFKSNHKTEKSSRSDTVAKCFECASYMPTNHRSSPCCNYNNTNSNGSIANVNSTSHLSMGLMLPTNDATGLLSMQLNNVGGGSCTMSGDNCRIGAGAVAGFSGIVGRCNSQHLLNGSSSGVGGVFDNLWSERLQSTEHLQINSSTAQPLSNNISINPFNMWNCTTTSNTTTNLFPNSTHLLNTLTVNANNNNNSSNNLPPSNAVSDSLLDIRSKLYYGDINPKRSPIKRLMMIYHCKFGEFGVAEGQFTEPSGVAVNAQNYIIVADTNNHRIQIFDKEGRFKFQFGECGKRDLQLLYPNRVAISRITGDIVVTERSPTHQVQIFNQYGQFVRKFGANILQHPRGITVDNQGRIIVVECKVMRVIIFDQNGNLLHKFGCSKHLRFPNGVVVNDKEEIFISDNRAHCVKVFSYEGHYLRQIGGEGLTNYPIGVCINSKGEILIADNHNNFNLTLFTQDGQFISAHESRVKHAQCFDVALIDDNSVVLASKDYRLYIYRYAAALPSGI